MGKQKHGERDLEEGGALETTSLKGQHGGAMSGYADPNAEIAEVSSGCLSSLKTKFNNNPKIVLALVLGTAAVGTGLGVVTIVAVAREYPAFFPAVASGAASFFRAFNKAEENNHEESTDCAPDGACP
jgi:hypothetical protein